jgi:type II secretion system protein H
MPQYQRDSGFTLIELLVTMSLLGVMMTIAVSGWTSWANASEQSGMARELQSALRQTQQRAVTEGNAMCLDFQSSSNQYTVYRGSCDDPLRVKVYGPVVSVAAKARIDSPVFTAPAGATSTGVTFYARGTAWPGTVKIVRAGTSKVYLLHVEGLTGRVSLS